MSETKAEAPGSRVFELFEEGKRFTEELMAENEKLRLANSQLKVELRSTSKSAEGQDAPYLERKSLLLEEEVQALRKENDALKTEFTTVEEENREFAERYVSVERQNSDLVHLYIASYQLHSTVDFDEVLRVINEIVINMIGSENFGVYVVDDEGLNLEMVTQEGRPDHLGDIVKVGEGILGESAHTGVLYTAPEGVDLKSGAQLIAVIPLKVGEDLIGAIGIHSLLGQKNGFDPVDFELFELLGGHAATALYVSKLYSRSERKRSTLEGFINMLKEDVQV